MANADWGVGLRTLISGLESYIEKALNWSENYKTDPNRVEDYTSVQIVALVEIFEAVHPFEGKIGRALDFTPNDVGVVSWLRDTYTFQREDVYDMVQIWKDGDSIMSICVFDMNRKYHILHSAVYKGDIEMVKWLLKLPIGVEERDEDDNTPLHIAAKYGHIDLVRMFLVKGASVFKMNTEGTCPFHLAFDRNHLECADLLSPRVFVGNRSDGGEEMLLIAVEDGNFNKVQYLLNYIHDLTVKSAALFFAARKGYPKILEVMLKNSYQLYLEDTDENGRTPLQLAVIGNHPEAVERLLCAGAKPSEFIYNYAKKEKMVEVIKVIQKCLDDWSY